MINFGDERLPDRFWEKCTPEPNSGCWLWTANTHNSGYGQFYWQGKPGQAHRVAYQTLIAAVPAELHLDHLCRQRCCVNPAHLEPVTPKENIRRGDCRETMMLRHVGRTHCKHGHELTDDNVYLKHWSRPDRLSASGVVRVCRICRVEQARKDNDREVARRAAQRLVSSG